MDKKIDGILDFWFGEMKEGEPPSSEKQKMWWAKDDSIDKYIEDNFGVCVEKASEGNLDSWLETPRGNLALIILLDQFSRNIYRDTPGAFENDSQALKVADSGITVGMDKELHPVMRIFFYIPFMHSEDLEMQKRSVELYSLLEEECRNNESVRKVVSNSLDFAHRHKEIIERFGRFPHRNDILGRESTPEEIEFLKKPGSSF